MNKAQVLKIAIFALLPALSVAEDGSRLISGKVTAASAAAGSMSVAGNKILAPRHVVENLSLGEDIALYVRVTQSQDLVFVSRSSMRTAPLYNSVADTSKERLPAASSSELAGIVGTGTQGIIGTGTQGIIGTGVQGIIGTGVQGIIGTGTQGIIGTGVQGIIGTGVQGIIGTGIQGIIGTGSN